MSTSLSTKSFNDRKKLVSLRLKMSSKIWRAVEKIMRMAKRKMRRKLTTKKRTSLRMPTKRRRMRRRDSKMRTFLNWKIISMRMIDIG